MAKMRRIRVGENVWRSIEDDKARARAIALIQAGVWYITLDNAEDPTLTPKPTQKPRPRR